MAAPAGGSSGSPDPGLPDRIPDDASELEPDRLAWLAEERTRRRKALVRRVLLTRLWARLVRSVPGVVVCIALLIMLTGLGITMVVHPPDAGPQAVALAGSPALTVPPSTAATPSTAAPVVEPPTGTILGRLLPEIGLSGDAGPVDTHSLRPAVIMLLPRQCDCRPQVGAVSQQAREFRLELWLVGAGPPSTADELRTIDQQGTAGTARWAVDGDAALVRTLQGHGLTLALIRADGVIVQVLRDLPADAARVPRLELVLPALAGTTGTTG